MNNILKGNNVLKFLEAIFTALDIDGINVDSYELDHICYRVSTIKKYKLLKKGLLDKGELLHETLISGRNISTFKLKTPILYKMRKIYILELPAPKYGSHYDDGFEHIEFIIDKSFEQFQNDYPHITFGKKAINKEINPDIKINYEGFSVKFHHRSLEYVVKNLES